MRGVRKKQESQREKLAHSCLAWGWRRGGENGMRWVELEPLGLSSPPPLEQGWSRLPRPQPGVWAGWLVPSPAALGLFLVPPWPVCSGAA